MGCMLTKKRNLSLLNLTNMKLQIFDNTNSKPKSPGRPSIRSISVYNSNGSISFSSLCAIDLNISTEKKVLFAKDEESRNNWYVAVSTTFDNGIQVRTKKNGGNSKDIITLSVSCRVVVDKLLNEYKAKKSAMFLISANGKVIDGIKWYRILSPIRIDGTKV